MTARGECYLQPGIEDVVFVNLHFADQRMAHVRSFQTGKHSALSQKILNEIAAARVCLLNAAKKRAYDGQLRKQAAVALPQARPLEVAGVKEEESVPTVFDFEPPRSRSVVRQRIEQRKKTLQVQVAIAAIAVGIVVVMAIVAVSNSQTGAPAMPEPEAVARKATPDRPAEPKRPKQQAIARAKRSINTNTSFREGIIAQHEKSSNDDAELHALLADLKPHEFASCNIEHSPPFMPLKEGTPVFLHEDQKRGHWDSIPQYLEGMVFSQNSRYQGMMKFQIETSGVVLLAVSKGWGGGGSGGSWQNRLTSRDQFLASGWRPAGSIDSGGHWAKSWELFYRRCTAGERFEIQTEKRTAPVMFMRLRSRDEMAPQGEPPQPHTSTLGKLPVPDAAAQQFSLEKIREIYKGQDRAAVAKKMLAQARETHVLLREAIREASATWQGYLAIEAIDTLAAEFDVSGPALKAEMLDEAVKRPRILPEKKRAIAEAAMRAIDEAVAEDNFDAAKKLMKIANQGSALFKDRTFAKSVLEKTREVDAAAKAFSSAQEALAVLKERHDDTEANLVLGKYLCFTKNDWIAGLPRLAKGADPTLQSLALRDIAGARSPEEQVRLGDAWWQGGYKTRAVYWYQTALPGLVGLEKERIKKKLIDSSDTIYLFDLPVQEEVLKGNACQSATFQGKPLLHSLNAHPPLNGSSSRIVYHLHKQYYSLQGQVGIQSGAKSPASPMTFRIVADGKLLWASRPMQIADIPQTFFVNVSGVEKLELFVDCPGNNSRAWAVWIEPLLKKGAPP